MAATGPLGPPVAHCKIDYRILLISAEDWATFIFLWSVVVVSLFGVCLVVGSMFVREQCRVNAWYLRRPMNHFLLTIMAAGMDSNA